MTAPIHYTAAELEAGLRAAGLSAGDTVFVHASLGRLGYPDRGRDAESACAVAYDALRAVIGESGTLVVPTYTYSIGAGAPFDVAATPSAVGPFTEYVRRQPGAIRSAEPMLSVAAVGRLAAALTADLPHTSYGDGSVYDRLCTVDAKLSLLGLDLHWATFRHFIEERARVPFRFLKTFTGTVRQDGRERRERWLYFAAPRQPECAPDGVPLARLAREAGLCRGARVGRGEVSVIGCREYLALGLAALARAPWLTAKGPALPLATLWAREDERVGARTLAVAVSAEASAADLLAALSPLRREVVSSGSEAVLEALGRVIPLDVDRIASGQACADGVVPEKWTLKEARVETAAGRLVFSSDDVPARVPGYARSFEGVVSRDTLLDHLHVGDRARDAVPFVSRRADPDWAFCCSPAERDSLTDAAYRVVLRAEQSFGALCVGQATLPGETEATVLLAAHLGPSGARNEGLSGAVVLVDAFRRLVAMGRRRATVRLVIAPAEIGFSAWLHACTDALRDVFACLAVDRVIGPGRLLVACRADNGPATQAVARALGRGGGLLTAAVPAADEFAAIAASGLPFYLLARGDATEGLPAAPDGESSALASAVAVTLDVLAGWDALVPEIAALAGDRAR